MIVTMIKPCVVVTQSGLVVIGSVGTFCSSKDLHYFLQFTNEDDVREDDDDDDGEVWGLMRRTVTE